MDIQVSDILEMKKNHPCGSNRWLVLRVGMDFRLRCMGCGREVMLPRRKAQQRMRRWYRQQAETGELMQVKEDGTSIQAKE